MLTASFVRVKIEKQSPSSVFVSMVNVVKVQPLHLFALFLHLFSTFAKQGQAHLALRVLPLFLLYTDLLFVMGGSHVSHVSPEFFAPFALI